MDKNSLNTLEYTKIGSEGRNTGDVLVILFLSGSGMVSFWSAAVRTVLLPCP